MYAMDGCIIREYGGQGSKVECVERRKCLGIHKSTHAYAHWSYVWERPSSLTHWAPLFCSPILLPSFSGTQWLFTPQILGLVPEELVVSFKYMRWAFLVSNAAVCLLVLYFLEFLVDASCSIIIYLRIFYRLLYGLWWYDDLCSMDRWEILIYNSACMVLFVKDHTPDDLGSQVVTVNMLIKSNLFIMLNPIIRQYGFNSYFFHSLTKIISEHFTCRSNLIH